jgi:hypothetical protein
VHARATIGACYTLAGKKAEAVKTRRKTLFPVLGMENVGIY